MRSEDLIESSDSITIEERRSFLRLPLEERRRKLSAQAERMLAHYSEPGAAAARAEWQAGDIVEF